MENQDNSVVPPEWTDIDGEDRVCPEGGNVDIGADEICGPAPIHKPDLTVTAITIPSSGSSGVPASIQWVVQNLGPGVAEGSWWDVVYLSADAVWDVNDTMVGRVPHTGPVAVGATYAGSSALALPGVMPGEYYVIVRTDGRDNLPEENEANNTGVSGMGGGQERISTDIPTLTLGTATTAQLSTGDYHYYKVMVEEGKDLKVNLDASCSDCSTELYVSYGSIPNRSSYDYAYSKPFQPDQVIRVPGTEPGWYYVLVYGHNVPGGPSGYSILAEELDLRVDRVSPPRGGNLGSLTITVDGAGLEEGCTLHLRSAEATVASSFICQRLDSTRLLTAVDLRGVDAGRYDVVVVNPDETSAQLSAAIEVRAGGGPKLRTLVQGPSAFRVGRESTFTVTFVNEGMNDIVGAYAAIDEQAQVPAGVRPAAQTSPSAPAAKLSSDAIVVNVGLLQAGASQSFKFVVDTATIKCADVRILTSTPQIVEEPQDDCDGIRTMIELNDWRRSLFEQAVNWAEKESSLAAQELAGLDCSAPDARARCAELGDRIRELEFLRQYYQIALSDVEANILALCVAYQALLDDGRCGSPLPEACLSPPSVPSPPTPEVAAVLYQYCVTAPIDPNEKTQPAGYGAPAYVAGQQVQFHPVYFENLPTATAWATRIDVTDEIDTDLDLSTLELREIGFSKFKVQVPPGRTHYATRLQLDAEFGSPVADVSADVDIENRRVHWTIEAIDPATGAPPVSPDLGILPPDDDNGRGEGYVSYAIKPRSDSPTGATIVNAATITFDGLESITTNAVQNTLDSGAPTSAVVALPAATGGPAVSVAWTAADDTNGSGLASVDVYVSDNGSEFVPWVTGSTETSTTFTGEINHTYRFYSIARDNVGNVEAAPESPDAMTQIVVFAPSSPSPADGATEVPVTTPLSWAVCPGAVNYDVYLWPDGSPRPAVPTASGLPTPSYVPPTAFNYATNYWWEVIAKGNGADAPGPRWFFRTSEMPGDGRLLDAKQKPNGTQVVLKGVVVTAVFGGFFYVENVDRVAGIRVAWPGSVQRGQLLDISGLIKTSPDLERYIEASQVITRGVGVTQPCGLRGRAVGGADMLYEPSSGARQKGVRGSWGPNNIGMLVRTWAFAVASRRSSDWFYVDDGSGVNDGTGIPGINVDATGLQVPVAGTLVVVTGISSCELYKGALVNVLRPRTNDDIMIISGVPAAPIKALDDPTNPRRRHTGK